MGVSENGFCDKEKGLTKFIGHFPCISRKCSSSDALAISEDEEGVYFGKCFSCDKDFGHNYLAKLMPELDIEFINWNKDEELEELYTEMGDVITVDQRKRVEDSTTINADNFRGIRQDVCSYYQIRTEFYNETGEVVKRYYPATENYELVGYKVRVVETKDFYPVGHVGKSCDFAGQFRHKGGAKTVIICGGEEDMAAAYQMLLDSWKKGSDGKPAYAMPAIISPLVGENCKSQIKTNYEWLDKADKIILCFDNDDAGKKATEDAVKVLPSGKVYVMDIPCKDPNACLLEGKHKEFVDAFWRNHKYVPVGITSSDNLEQKMMEYVSMERISLPPFMHKMEEMLRGGIPLGYIVNLLAASGQGKSTIADAMVLHWIMKNPYTVGIVSLESSEGEYGVNLSSAFCGFKLNMLRSAQERVEWLQRPENVAKRRELWVREDGSPRFYLVDADIENLQKKVEYGVKILGWKICILDPLQDIFDCLDSDQQAKFMKWQKDLVKEYSMVFLNINHSRKSQQGQKANSQGANLSEEDMHGSSSIFKSGGINIVIGRNKEAEEDVERNTTYVKLTKARGVGNTGPAGAYYYDNETHTLYDKDDYFSQKPVSNLEGFEIQL